MTYQHIACTHGHYPVAEYLILHGANVHVRDHLGHTALFNAACGKHEKVVRLLHKAGAHFNNAELDEAGFRVMVAAAEGNVEIVRAFALGGFDMNRRGLDRRTVLHMAAVEGRVNVIELLVGLKGVNLSPKDRWGRTPLDDAAGHYPCMRVLEDAIREQNNEGN